MCSAGGEDDSNDESIEGDSLTEDHHQHNSHIDVTSAVGSNSGVTNVANAEA